MIRVERAQGAPAALDKKYSSASRAPKTPGSTEFEAVLALYDSLRPAPGELVAELSFPYARYKEDDVRGALEVLFHKKCAYCESHYAGTQPMDVEHWRPKGEIRTRAGATIKPGYYWLASTWENLLPSCIDCNRSRRQDDALTGTRVSLGKKNQFPVANPDQRPKEHGHDPELKGGEEKPLLLNPCVDDPEEFLRYNEEGIVLPRVASGEAHERALESIRVYALNRADLVSERRAIIELADHRVELIGQLAQVRELIAQIDTGDQSFSAADRDALTGIVLDLISNEIDALMAMTGDEQPYAGLARQLLRDAGTLG